MLPTYTALCYVGGQPVGLVDVHPFIELTHVERDSSLHLKPTSTEYSLLSWTRIQLVHRRAELLVIKCAGAQSAAFWRARMTDWDTQVHPMQTQTCSHLKAWTQIEGFKGHVCTYERGSDMKLEKVTWWRSSRLVPSTVNYQHDWTKKYTFGLQKR